MSAYLWASKFVSKKGTRQDFETDGIQFSWNGFSTELGLLQLQTCYLYYVWSDTHDMSVGPDEMKPQRVNVCKWNSVLQIPNQFYL